MLAQIKAVLVVLTLQTIGCMLHVCCELRLTVRQGHRQSFQWRHRQVALWLSCLGFLCSPHLCTVWISGRIPQSCMIKHACNPHRSNSFAAIYALHGQCFFFAELAPVEPERPVDEPRGEDCMVFVFEVCMRAPASCTTRCEKH